MFILLMGVLYEINHDYFIDPDELGKFLRNYLWPPERVEELCLEFPHLPEFPSFITLDSSVIEVLLATPYDYLEAAAQRVSVKAAFIKNFGKTTEIMQMRLNWIAESGSAEGFDKEIMSQLDFYPELKNRGSLGFRVQRFSKSTRSRRAARKLSFPTATSEYSFGNSNFKNIIEGRDKGPAFVSEFTTNMMSVLEEINDVASENFEVRPSAV